MGYKKFQTYFFAAILAVSAILTLVVFRSYLVFLAFGGVLAIVVLPLYRYLYKLLRFDVAAAFLSVILVALTLLLPTAYFLASLTNELGGVIADVRSFFDLETLTNFLTRVLPPSMQLNVPAMTDEVLNVLRNVVGTLSNHLVGFFSNIMDVVVGFIVILISMYYILKDGPKIKREILQLSPLGDDQDDAIYQRIITAIRAVMGGVLVLGLVKGILAGLSFWIFGVPAPLFWGSMTGIASFLPVIGSGLVTVPMVLYLLALGKMWSAFGLALVSFAVIGTVDNFLQPKIVGDKTKIHPLLILLSVLGGIDFYGFAGFILGPLTLAVTMALIDIYKKDFKGNLDTGE